MTASTSSSILNAMLQQEETGYIYEDYFRHHHEIHGPGLVNNATREMMVDWCYRIVDICKFNSETVEIAMSYLDRFLTTEKSSEMGALHNPSVFQLSVMTALYTAIKIHEPTAMNPELLSRLSQGMYTVQQIEFMEVEILQALNWRMNPPTAHAFVQQFLEHPSVVSSLKDNVAKQTVEELCMMQIQLAVKDYKFIMVKKSALAFSCVMNALESIFCRQKGNTITATISFLVGDELSQAVNVDWRSPEFMEIQNCLYATTGASLDVSTTVLDTTTKQEENKLHGYSSSSLEASPRSTVARRI